MPERKVAQVDDLSEGQMIVADVEGTAVLVALHAGRFYAVGSTCPHHGAPLAEGTLENGRLTCPWHASVFDITSGDFLEPPTLDALPRYEVRVEDEAVYVRIPEHPPKARTMGMAPRDRLCDGRTFVLIGGGAASLAAAESLRQCGFQGRIVLVSDDAHPPYDRTYLSKQYLAGQLGDAHLPLRSESFYRQHEIEWRRGQVVALDVPTRHIVLAEGDSISADAILVATGGVPRTLDVPGAELAGILTLRSWEDSRRIREALHTTERIVIVGAGLLGMEAAASLASDELLITIVATEAIPLERAFGREVGQALQRLHEEQGIRFRTGQAVRAFLGETQVRAVELEDGSRIDADLVVLGLGVRPATEFLRGVPLNDDGGVNVDENLQLAEGVYAAGDIACYPDVYAERRVRMEHWRLALQQGRKVGQRMAQWGGPFRSVPFFWTRQFGETFGCAGHTTDWENTIVTGNLRTRQFTAYYARADRLCAVLSSNSEHIAHFLEQMRRGQLPPAPEIRPFVSPDPGVDLLRVAAAHV